MLPRQRPKCHRVTANAFQFLYGVLRWRSRIGPPRSAPDNGPLCDTNGCGGAIKYELPSRQPVEVTFENQRIQDQIALSSILYICISYVITEGAPMARFQLDLKARISTSATRHPLTIVPYRPYLKHLDPPFLPAFRLLIHPYLSPKIWSRSNRSIQLWLALNTSSSSFPV